MRLILPVKRSFDARIWPPTAAAFKCLQSEMRTGKPRCPSRAAFRYRGVFWLTHGTTGPVHPPKFKGHRLSPPSNTSACFVDCSMFYYYYLQHTRLTSSLLILFYTSLTTEKALHYSLLPEENHSSSPRLVPNLATGGGAL